MQLHPFFLSNIDLYKIFVYLVELNFVDMKIVFVVMFVLIANIVYSSCDSYSGYNVVVGNKETISHEDIVMDMGAIIGCDWTWIGNPLNAGYGVFLDEGGNESWMSQQCLDIVSEPTFSTEELVNQMRLNPYYTAPGGMLNMNDGKYFIMKFLHFRGVSGGLFTTTDVWYEYTVTVFHAENVEILVSSVCSGVPYYIWDLIDANSVDSNHNNIELISSEGDVYDGSSQEIILSSTFSGYISIEYSAEAAPNVFVYKEYQITIGNLFEAEFIDVANNPGPLLSSSPSSLMSSYVSSTGGQLEYSGSGIEEISGNYYFNPSLGSVGSNLVAVRTEANGCLSDWRDTIFYITNTVSNFSAPVWDVSYTFNGDNGASVNKRINGVEQYVGKFHFGCGGESYSFKPLNQVVDLDMEYKIIYHNNVIGTGVLIYGDDIDLTMPTNVNNNQVSSIYDLVSLLLVGAGGGGGFDYNLLLNYYNGDMNGDGVLNQSDLLSSNNLGDHYKIIGRYVNVLNEYSDWSTFVVGLVEKPKHTNESLLCFDGNPMLSPVTNTVIYHDSVDYDSYRSVVWDVNMDGVPDLNGGIDNVVYPLINIQKTQEIISLIVDSVKVRGFNVANNGYNLKYLNGVSKVCYSGYDTINVVRKPSVVYSIDTVGTLGIGEHVVSFVSGDWFNPIVDTINWQWSDGSPEYSGDINYHFLNEVGYYSLHNKVNDEYGCYSDTIFVNAWNVQGVLDIDNIEYDSFVLYPVPVVDVLKVKSIQNVERIVVYDLNGRVVGESSSSEINIEQISSGVYQVEVYVNNNVLKRKIVKN